MSIFTNIEHDKKVTILIIGERSLKYHNDTYEYIINKHSIYNPYVPKQVRVKLVRRNKINNKLQTSNFFIAN